MPNLNRAAPTATPNTLPALASDSNFGVETSEVGESGFFAFQAINRLEIPR